VDKRSATQNDDEEAKVRQKGVGRWGVVIFLAKESRMHGVGVRGVDEPRVVPLEMVTCLRIPNSNLQS